ncbi:MAG: HAMP domain-containing histidine kinase [Oscillospiraceae bacterium]|jgi:signal transduction histidine kinase|nr:HAMP domain-containing histidine kinase [Oscillospiraceae bacterium]
MLRKLKIKIIAAVLGTLFFVFASVLLVLNLSVYQTSVKRAEDFMDSVVRNDGFQLPARGKLGAPRAGRFFYAKVNGRGIIVELNLDMMFDFTPSDARSVIAGAVDSRKEKGGVGNFLFITADKPYGKMLVFSERSVEMGLLETLTATSLRVAGIVCVILACLAVFLAKWIVAPVQSAFDKQRRFVSDASHELKTPLTIIGANADVLRNEIGENVRLAHIRAQSERMSGLIHSLLTLAKADEGRTDIIKNEFSLSHAVLNVVLEFESRAFEEGKQYSYDIEPNSGESFIYIGDEGRIKQLVSVLIDNAIRYSDAGGQIRVSLRADGAFPAPEGALNKTPARGRPRPCLSVFNTGVGVSREERGKIFERFYRSDESRSRETGGYGVGLSIAKSVADAHRAKIAVSGEYGSWIRFDVMFY